MSFREIRPAPSKGLPSPHIESSTTGKRRATRTRQQGTVAQACDACRKSKTKCDGEHPVCEPCLKRRRECGYAMSRLESLEKFVSTLRESSPHRAERLLRHVRVTGDISGNVPDAQEKQSAEASVDSVPAPTGPEQSSELPSPGSIVPLAAHATSLPQTDQFSRFLQAALSDAPVILAAIDSFFTCSDTLLHVFTRHEIDRCARNFCQIRGPQTLDEVVSICPVMAVAAVGAQYRPEKFSDQVATGFYDVAARLLDTTLSKAPLNGLKASVLLADYNVMDKPTTSIVFVDRVKYIPQTWLWRLLPDTTQLV